MSDEISFTRQADELLALTGEMELNGDLLEAVRKLRAVSIEHDEVNARFDAAANEVKRLLRERLELAALATFLRATPAEVEREGPRLRLLPPLEGNDDKEVPF